MLLCADEASRACRPRWLCEVKFDGYRALLLKNGRGPSQTCWRCPTTARRLGVVLLLFVGSWLGFAPASWADTIAFITSNRFHGAFVDYLADYGHDVRYVIVAGAGHDEPDLTLADLRGVDTLLIASNVPYARPAAVGNVAAAFADSGRGVVLAYPAFQEPWNLDGRIMSSGYSPFTIGPDSTFGEGDRIGVVVDPMSPLFTGVDIANILSTFKADVHLVPGATLIAAWDSLVPAFAFNSLGQSRVVGLNLYPRAEFAYNTATLRLISNALFFASGNGPSPQTPEPSTMLLIGAGAAAAALRRARLGARRARSGLRG
jgi:hypothetical protein